MIKKEGHWACFLAKHFASSTIPTRVLAHFKILDFKRSTFTHPLFWLPPTITCTHAGTCCCFVCSLREPPRRSRPFISGASISFNSADFVLNCISTALFTTSGTTKHVFAKQLLAKAKNWLNYSLIMSTDAIRSKEKILVVRRIMLSLYQHLVCFANNFIHLCIWNRVSCSVVLVLVSYKLEGFDVRSV